MQQLHANEQLINLIRFAMSKLSQKQHVCKLSQQMSASLKYIKLFIALHMQPGQADQLQAWVYLLAHVAQQQGANMQCEIWSRDARRHPAKYINSQQPAALL